MTSTATATLPTLLMLSATLLTAISGLPLLVRTLQPATAQRIATVITTLAAGAGTAGALAVLLGRNAGIWNVDWPLPFGPTTFGLDPLTALVALPILIISACCSIYALDYWPAASNLRTVRKLTIFFGLMVASMLGVVMARSAGLFLLAWEIMALSAYFILTTDDHTPAVRDAGTVYMICTHIGTLALFALFALLKVDSGSFVFPMPGSLSAVGPLATACFLLMLFGFGFKAGVMPLHIWLPAAHANAPSHVSAIMSGVILKIGIYGLIRFLSFFTGIPLWWGMLVLTLGMISGIVGVIFALGQHDLKRLLAYHSIENIGIIVMGIGTALIGAATGSSLLVLLGLAGALLHLINHATFKALLFLGAGSIIHGTGTREIDRMGGLLRRQPWTSAAFLTGAVAICGLPPLNGFISELLIYLGFFNGVIGHDGAAAIGAALATPALALIGGLAVACFVKVFGVVFLGEPRTPEAARAHEAGWLMRTSMIILATICVTIGIAPVLMAPLLDAAVSAWLPGTSTLPALASVAPFTWITVLALSLISLLLLGVFWLRSRLLNAPLTNAATWGCGYLAPTSRMQYSASSFAALLVDFFSGLLRPERHAPLVQGPFPAKAHFASHVPETVLEHVYLPLLGWINLKLSVLRRVQHGQLHLYILYTLITLIVLILISLP
ncbi:MAG: proton-conducting transporter membrane subunit [Trichlorobacter sp.]